MAATDSSRYFVTKLIAVSAINKYHAYNLDMDHFLIRVEYKQKILIRKEEKRVTKQIYDLDKLKRSGFITQIYVQGMSKTGIREKKK